MALRTLYQTLLDSDLVRLRVIAQQWGIPLSAEHRTDVAIELADAMARADMIEHILSLLSDEARSALDDMLRRGGAMPWTILCRRWGELRAVGPGRLEREALWREPISSVEILWYLGLLQRAFEERDSGQVEMAFVPEELRLYIPTPPPLAMPLPEPVKSPTYEFLGADTFAEELVTLWAVLQAESVDPSVESWRKSVLNHMLNAQMCSSNLSVDSRLAFLEIIALEQEWVRQEKGTNLRVVPEPMLAWLQSDLWSQWATLARAWMGSERYNDLSWVASLRPDSVKGWPNDSLQTRGCVLDVLRRFKPGFWYSIAQLIAYVREYATDFLRPDGDYDVWALRDALTDKPLRGFEVWEAVEGALINFIVTGPMYWLGMVDLGGTVSSLPVTTFRLNAAGSALLGAGDPPSIAEPLPLRWLGNEALLVPFRRRYERFQLSRIARLIKWDDEGAHYRITPRSLTRAKQQRISVPRIFDFLESATGRPVPAHFQGAIEQTYAGQSLAHIEQVWLLRVDDPALLESPNLRYLIREQLGPGLALVHENERERVLAVLSKRGILLEFDNYE